MYDKDERFNNDAENPNNEVTEENNATSENSQMENENSSDDTVKEPEWGNADETTKEPEWDSTPENNSYNNYTYNSSQNQSPGNTPNKKKKSKKVPTIIAVCVVVIALFGTGIYALTKKIDSIIDQTYSESIGDSSSEEDDTTEYTTIESTDTSNSSTSTSSEGVVITDVSDVVDEVMPSIVAITSTTYVESNDYYSWIYGSDSSYYEETGAGSGIIIEETDTELLIVTNNHVVEGADSLSIQFINDVSIEGYVKGTDADTDLAIVSVPLSDIDSDTLSQIKKATLGNSDDVEVGDGVIAIGNALGYGQSVTTGVISAKDREITIDDCTITVLQTDAAINGGNSGGALLNSAGEVIGINCAKYSSSSYSGSASIEGMGFAIPISSATDTINELMNRETRTLVDEADRGTIGIYGYDVSEEDEVYYSIPQGVYITEVIEGGAAEAAGLAATDVITGFDGQTVTTMEGLKSLLEYYKAGETVTITVQYRDGREYVEKDVEITLGSSSDTSSAE